MKNTLIIYPNQECPFIHCVFKLIDIQIDQIVKIIKTIFIEGIYITKHLICNTVFKQRKNKTLITVHPIIGLIS